MTAQDVIREYFRYLSKIEGTQLKAPQFQSTRLQEQAGAFITWCEENNIRGRDVGLFLQFRLDGARARRFRVPFKALPNAKMATAWHAWGAQKYRVRAWEDQQHAGMRTERVTQIKDLRRLLPATESYQIMHLREGRADVCMATPDYSGGFHPKSRACVACPMAIQCAAKLCAAHGFDVPALRRDELYKLPSEVLAAVIA
jgi:hypothetical protein